MKQFKRIGMMIGIGSLVLVSVAAAGPGAGNAQAGSGDHDAVLAGIPVEPLNAAEREALTYMIEEEKLARDVYIVLGEQWGVPVFSNIAEAEQQHVDSVMSLLDRYDIDAPVTMSRPGEFENAELQGLYDALVADGARSIEAALTVGAMIEDTDIADLQHRLESVDNQDIRMVFESLLSGSENHMRAFVGQLERYGADYEPQFIDSDYYEEILAGTQGGPGRNAGRIAGRRGGGRYAQTR